MFTSLSERCRFDAIRGPAKENKGTGQLASNHEIFIGQIWSPLARFQTDWLTGSNISFSWHQKLNLITRPQNRGRVIFSLQFVCVCVCLPVCVSVNEQNSSQTNEPIWKWFSLNVWLSHWLEPYWNWWPLVEGKGHSNALSIFLHNSLLTSQLWISALLYPIKINFGMSLNCALAPW